MKHQGELDPDAQDFADWSDLNAQPDKPADSGLWENFTTAIDQFEAESSAISGVDLGDDWFSSDKEWFTSKDESQKQERANQIQTLIRNGDLPTDIMDKSRVEVRGWGDKINYDEIARYVNDNNLVGDIRIPTDEDFRNRQLDYFNAERKIRDDIRKRATFGGDVMAFVGGVGAGFTDLLTLATIPLAIPLTGLVATSRVAYAASVAGREALLNMGLQAIEEPFISSWQEKMGMEYNWKDGSANMIAAGLFGGAIGGIQGTFAYKFTTTGFKSTDHDQLVKEYKKAGFNEDDAAVMATAKRELNLGAALGGEQSPKNFVETLEGRHEALTNDGPRANDRRAPEHTTDDEVAIQQMYDDVDESVMFFKEDDTGISVKQMVAEDEASLTRLNEAQTCIMKKVA